LKRFLQDVCHTLCGMLFKQTLETKKTKELKRCEDGISYCDPGLISFAISAVLGPVIIPFLRKLKMGQTERTEGVQSHLKKAGTPTMGGVIFLISTIITSLFYVKDYPKIIPVLFLTLGFGLIGFLDDYLKVVLRRSDGLLPWQKFLLQVVVTGIFTFYLLRYTDVS